MINEITFTCKDARYKTGVWRLQVHQENASIADPDGAIVCSFPHDEAESRFVLPSFWQSINYIGFKTDDGNMICFQPGAHTAKSLETYFNEVVKAQGMVSNLAWSGGLYLLLGFTAICTGIFMTCYTFKNPINGYSYVYYGAILTGPIVGSVGWRKVARAMRIWNEQPNDT